MNLYNLTFKNFELTLPCQDQFIIIIIIIIIIWSITSYCI